MGLVHRSVRKATASRNGDTTSNRNDGNKSFSPWRLLQRLVRTRLVVIGFFMFILLRCLHQVRLTDDTETLSLIFTEQINSNTVFQARPLMVQVTIPFSLINITRLEAEQEPPHLIRKRRNRFWIDHGTKQHKMPEEVPEGCVAEAEWINDRHPSCNLVHDVDMRDFFFAPNRDFVKINGHRRRKKFRMIGRGGFRSAFLFHEHDGTRRVLKTLVYRDDRPFTPRMEDRMRRDAIISEQLTSSKYIADIYGYCGQAALVDYSDEDDMLKLFKQKQKPRKDALFQIAHDVAQSVADAHRFNKEGRATLVHMDIKPNQWIWLDDGENQGFKLNDFNLAKFLSWDPVKKENCHVATGYSEGRWQAPEQFTEESPRSEKADTFSLGYILNFLLTGKRPFPELDGRGVQDTVSNGTMWKITDPAIVNSTHPFDINVRQAVDMCLKFKPEDRPNAQEVADLLRNALAEYKKSKQIK